MATLGEMQPAEERPTRCPRCPLPLIRQHDEVLCLVHGTIYTPVRGWDLGSMGVLEAGLSEERGAKRRPSRINAVHKCDRCGRRLRVMDQSTHWMVCPSREAEVARMVERCAVCGGSGFESGWRGKSGEVCEACRGMGRVAQGEQRANEEGEHGGD